MTGEERSVRSCAVLQRLDIGPTRVEKRRIVTPYRVTAGADVDALDLVYRYEEDVFDPGDEASANLAAMIGAQVALNYGLFFREIHFHDPFDDHDRRILDAMMRCTGREIFVKKLLEPNPFFTRDAPRPRIQARGPFLNARVFFEDAQDSACGKPGGRRVDPDTYCVLLSGGKESLLSFGLLRELGGKPRPVFVNESGRHWYTALNSYRYFREHVRETARVWTNADRLFAWMLRRLPFIRQDFFRLRSDEYPLRLWTVAVFLFGALPVVRKHGIGNLVIGDEHDTSRVVHRDGLLHFDGLYDQSIFFDRAMTRYFSRKGWGIRQLSLLRTLSEILVLRILTRRYPDIQKNQTSCHMAHIEGDRVFPCGGCEKCRRIVGMLLAVGSDPQRIGYRPEQIEDCLRSLPVREVHQEEAAAQHMLHLLREKGMIGSAAGARARPEIETLRVDPLVSPASEIPDTIRDDIVAIFGSYAKGFERGGAWEE